MTIRCRVLCRGIFLFFAINAMAMAAPSPSPSRAPYNQCVASVWESLTQSPYSGVCEKSFVYGKYVCQDYAREHCKFIDENNANENQTPGFSNKMGCWVLGFTATNDVDTNYECAAKACDVKIAFQLVCNENIKKCFHTYLEGHAINIIRVGGEYNLKRYGSVIFNVYEPQEKDPNSANICTWTQKKLEPPEIPLRCKAAILKRYKMKQYACGINYKFAVYDYRNFSAPRGYTPPSP